MKTRKKPRRLSLVRFTFKEQSRAAKAYPFSPLKTYVFLGEIPNMPQHCVVADAKSGRVWTGYHSEAFTEIPEDET